MNRERLLKLADHLESGKLGHERFDFGTVSEGPRNPARHNCGTAGCALGELPVVWPEEFEFYDHPLNMGRMSRIDVRAIARHGNSYEDVFNVAVSFFDILMNEADGLFIGSYEDEDEFRDETDDARPWNSFVLYEDATPQQVAAGIRNFVRWREEQA